MTQGFFELQTPQDLLQKLRQDFGRLKESPVDSYAAFDFFVTAYHMLDWRYPGKSNNAKRRQMERDGKSKLLWVCSHLANGSKHFQATRREAVNDTIVHQGPFDPNAFDSNAFDVVELRVKLDGEAARQFGDSIAVLELAGKARHFWEGSRLAPFE